MATSKDLLGIDFTRVDTERKHTLGSEVESSNGKVFRYVKASAAIAAGDAVMEDTAAGANVVKKTSGVAVPVVGIAETALAANEYGWITVRGVVTSANVATGSTAGKPLGPSSTAGRLTILTVSATPTQAEVQAAVAAAAGVGIFGVTDAASNVGSVRLV